MKKILWSIVILSTAIILTGCGNKVVDNEEEKINTNENVIKDQIVDGLKFTNTSLKTSDGISTLETKVSNNTGSDYSLKQFTIIIKGENDNVLATIPGIVDDVIPNNSYKYVNTSIDIDLSEAYSVEYTIEK